MSALPPKADIVPHGGNVRFVPRADITSDRIVGLPELMNPDNRLVGFGCDG